MKSWRRYINVYFTFFSVKEKNRIILLFFLTTAMAILDLLGIASLLPFLQVVADPASIQTNPLLNIAWNFWDRPKEQKFLLYTGITVFLFLLGGNLFKAAGTYIILRFTNAMRYHIGRRLYHGYLHQSYDFFLGKHSSEMVKKIIHDVDMVVSNIYVNSATIVANAIISLFIVTGLVLYDWKLAFITAVVLGGAFGSVFIFTQKKLHQIGKIGESTNAFRNKVVAESFGGIKEIKLKGDESVFSELFAEASFRFARAIAQGGIIGQLPKYLLESIAFGGIMLIVLYLIAVKGNITSVLPTIGFFAFAAYKLMPNLQIMLNASAAVRITFPVMHKLYEDYNEVKAKTEGQKKPVIALPFQSEIRLEQIHFRYPGAPKSSLTEVSAVINKNSVTALTGQSGSGKSTLIDVLLGLLTPQSGKIFVDNQELDENTMPSWQNKIGYVPQHIFLIDNTVAANIAFTLNPDTIDMGRVKEAARIANIDQFIENELEGGYLAQTGERGTRLSGGQRQRIGIARALYNQPEVLVLDEGTSALDEKTEREVLRRIRELKHTTVIMITHRPSTLSNCEKIIHLENGSVATSPDGV